ncbi:hypothetical protein [Streptomyces sp. NPDC057623]|uniref:hypothetical protein n=1 Tax=Streptomyces sp. NPDC057623 TaxID=3346187 RepID=UPI0036C1C0D2
MTAGRAILDAGATYIQENETIDPQRLIGVIGQADCARHLPEDQVGRCMEVICPAPDRPTGRRPVVW